MTEELTELTAQQARETVVPWTKQEAAPQGDRFSVIFEAYHIQHTNPRPVEVISRVSRGCEVEDQAYLRNVVIKPGEEVVFNSGWLDDNWREFVCCHNVPPQRHQKVEGQPDPAEGRGVLVVFGNVAFRVAPGAAFVGEPEDRTVPIKVRNVGTVSASVTLFAAPK